MDEHIRKAGVLIEALPYLQQFRGETFLIKLGGSAMDDPQLVDQLLRDVVFLEVVGINPVLVHGGGKAISAAMAKSGLQAKFIGGLRVTNAESIAIVEQTLSNEINPRLVEGLVSSGGKAIGIPGNKVFIGERILGHDPETNQPADLGFVGKVTEFDSQPIEEALYYEKVPVISPIALEKGTGQTLNVNADLAASALGAHLKASKVVYLSDVRGVMEDPADPNTLIPSLNHASVESLIANGTISGGMIPKVRSALDALDAGVGKVHLVDGRIPHSLLLEIFTKSGVGTEIISA
ncbi:MAG: acetylglutamate kinase [Verrucomicrobiales bacterium]|jgi:acetylglutamate kinase